PQALLQARRRALVSWCKDNLIIDRLSVCRFWHFSDTTFVPVDVRLWGAQRKTFARSGYFAF
ncbi:MAG TPA: hypothetical protein VNO32_52035, partial [Candidatus Acidoferrum sp.]|nr:hypothetical protein [Candidatus Acidoferrum sp.]